MAAILPRPQYVKKDIAQIQYKTTESKTET